VPLLFSSPSGCVAFAIVDTDTEMRARFAYIVAYLRRHGNRAIALNSAMGRKGWKAPDLAKAIHRDASTVSRWVNGEGVPNLFMVKPIADALEVRAELLFDPPPIPEYPLERYLVDAGESGAEEGRRRATTAQPSSAPGTRPRTPAPRARGA
jgi:transcriptional regulator with XRE-family HTH domain